MAVPKKGRAFLIVVGNNALFVPITPGRRNSLRIELACDRAVSIASGAPKIDLTDNRRGDRIYDQSILVLRVFLVPIGSITSNVISLLALGGKRRTCLTGNILGIVVIDDVFQCCGKLFRGVQGRGVIAVIDGNKPYTPLRKLLLKKTAGLHIVSPQA